MQLNELRLETVVSILNLFDAPGMGIELTPEPECHRPPPMTNEATNTEKAEEHKEEEKPSNYTVCTKLVGTVQDFLEYQYFMSRDISGTISMLDLLDDLSEWWEDYYEVPFTKQDCLGAVLYLGTLLDTEVAPDGCRYTGIRRKTAEEEGTTN